MIVVIVLFLVVILLISRHWRSEVYQKVHRELGSSLLDVPLLGVVLSFIGSNEVRMNAFNRFAYDSYTNKHGGASAWFGPALVTFIADPDQAIAVLKATNKKGYVERLAQRLIGNGLVVAPVNIWHPRRKILQLSFSSKHLTQFVHIFDSQSRILCDNLASQVGKGNFSIWNYISLLSLDSICETAFGIDIKIQTQPHHTLFDGLTQYLKNGSIIACQPLLHKDVIYNLLPISKEQERLKKIIFDFIDDLINKKKSIMSGELTNIEDLCGGNVNVKDKLYFHFSSIFIDKIAEPSRVPMESFLESMMKMSEESGKKYTLKELRDEVLTLAVAGSDTSATGSCFVTTLLSHHPDVQEKAYQEILEVLGPNKPIEMADLQKLKYLDAVIKESLRLYPPVPIINRKTVQETLLPSGLVLPNRHNVVIHIWGLHHNPRYWGPDVEEFNPDRFISRPPPVAGAFMPFSMGARNCIGYQYAMLAMKTTIATLLRNYRIKPATSYTYGKDNPLRTSFNVMSRHVDEFEVQIERRSH